MVLIENVTLHFVGLFGSVVPDSMMNNSIIIWLLFLCCCHALTLDTNNVGDIILLDANSTGFVSPSLLHSSSVVLLQQQQQVADNTNVIEKRKRLRSVVLETGDTIENTQTIDKHPFDTFGPLPRVNWKNHTQQTLLLKTQTQGQSGGTLNEESRGRTLRGDVTIEGDDVMGSSKHRDNGSSSGVNPTPLLSHHGGTTMSHVIVIPIFWGITWTDNPGDKILGMMAFYQGMGGSQYAAVSNEYHDATSLITYNTQIGYIIDATPAKSGDRPSVILLEVCKVIADLHKSSGFVPTVNHYFPVYTDLSSITHSYCAYHTGGYCPDTSYANTPIQFAFFWQVPDPPCLSHTTHIPFFFYASILTIMNQQVDQYDPGCSIRSRHALPLTSKGISRPSLRPSRSLSPSPHAVAPVPFQSPGLMAIADASAHELSEVRTDPWPFTGWYNHNGLENGDLCKGVHGKTPVMLGETSWWLQGEFSNHAYVNGIGIDSDTGFILGCIDGTNDEYKKS